MRPGNVTLAWAASQLSGVLLALVVAFLAGLIALTATAGTGSPTLTNRAVGTAFGSVFVVLVARNPRQSPEHIKLSHRYGSASPSRSVSAILTVGAIILSFFVTYPRWTEIDNSVLGNTGDSGLNIFILEWQIHAMGQDIGGYFDPNILDPERFTLVWGPTLTPLVPFYALFKALSTNPVLSFNLLMVMATFLTLIAGYVFLRQASFSQFLAGVGALLHATTGQRAAHLGHLDSYQTLWIPVFGTLIVLVWTKGGLRYAVGLGLALGLSLLNAPYYFLGGTALCGAMVVLGLKDPKNVPWKGLLVAAGSALLVSGPILVMSRLAGLSRSVQEVFPVHWADFYHPGAFTPGMRWLAAAAASAGGGATLENWLFPSLALTVLGGLGAGTWLRSFRKGSCPLPHTHPCPLPKLLFATAAVGIVMAAGPYLSLAGRRIPLPMLALIQAPGFDTVRVTGRFMALAYLPLTVLALVGLQAASCVRRRSLKVGLFTILIGCILATTLSFQPLTPIDVSGKPAIVNRALASKPRGVVVELPWPSCPGEGCLYTEPPRMIWSRYDWLPRLGGYRSHVPDYWLEAQESLANFPDFKSMNFLDRFGVRYVILRVSAGEQGQHFDMTAASRMAEQARRTRQIGAVQRFGDDYLVTLR